jgi:hypothetical protein
LSNRWTKTAFPGILSGFLSSETGVILLVVIAGIAIALFGWDRYRDYRKIADNDRASQPTSEAFIDPETGRRMRVWYDPSTGRRDYRPE